MRRRVWSRNIKNMRSIYIYDISSLRVNKGSSDWRYENMSVDTNELSYSRRLESLLSRYFLGWILQIIKKIKKTDIVGDEFCVIWLKHRHLRTLFNQRSTQYTASTLPKPRISNTASLYHRNEIQAWYPTM